MKKYFLKFAVVLAMALMFTACGGNIDTEAADEFAETKTEDQEDNLADIQEESQADIQKEDQAIQEENRAGSERASETETNDNETELEHAIEPAEDAGQSEAEEEKGEQTEMKMNVQVGDYTFTATLENNTAVKELTDMMKEGPVTIQMSDYSGFEKVGPLGTSLTANNSQTTTNAGDIVLYSGNNIVMFYGSNSWSYTRIGRIDDLTDWEKALGSGNITAVFTLAE